jgi:hypothetical protein
MHAPINSDAGGVSPQELIWINKFLSTRVPISLEDVDSVLCFSLLWNMFEGLVCGKNASIPKIEMAVEKIMRAGNLNPRDYEDHLAYFRRRYVEDGSVNDRFDGLRFRPRDREDLVRDVLVGQVSAAGDILLALLIIVYRFRNNLFHGEKSLRELPSQKGSFSVANCILMQVMEAALKEAKHGLAGKILHCQRYLNRITNAFALVVEETEHFAFIKYLPQIHTYEDHLRYRGSSVPDTSHIESYKVTPKKELKRARKYLNETGSWLT